jgi:hypothetical protein
MMRFAIWLTIILFAAGASAGTTKRKPASEAYEMRVSVVFGDRSTQFFVGSSGNDGVLKISNDRGVCTENRIRVDDVMESPKLAE